MHAGFGAGDRAIAHHRPVGKTHLARQDHAVAQTRTPGDAHLGCQSTALAGGHAMADVHQVVDFGASPDVGFAHRRAIDGAAATHLHAVFQDHLAGLGHLAPAAGGRHKAEALAADHGVRVHHTAAAQAGAGVEHGTGMEFTAFAELHVVVEHHVGVKDAAGADLHLRPDHHLGSHVGAHAHNGSGVDDGAGVNAGLRAVAGMEGFEGFGKGQPGIAQGDPCQAAICGLLLQGFGLLAPGWNQHRTGAAGGQCCRQGMARFQETQLAGPGLIEGGSTTDLGVAGQVARAGISRLAQMAEQFAEAHSRGAGQAGS
jgi:hypothetical protein